MIVTRFFAILAVVCLQAGAEDWPQFGGPQRDNVSRETGLLRSWPESGPERLWLATDLGAGYSGPAIVGDRVFIMGQRGKAQWLICRDGRTGQELWSTRLGATYQNEFGDGPRGTPTVSQGQVIALGANGELLCAEAATGKERWRASLTNFGGTIPGWGYSESPLVERGRVWVTPGGRRGAVIALDQTTGQLLWQTAEFTDEAQYTSLMALEKDGVRQIVAGTREHVTGLAADDGRLLWQERFRSSVVVAQTPIVSGDQIYVTASGGTGSRAVKLAGAESAEVLYSNKVMKNLPGGVVLFEGHVYGYSDSIGWVCQSWKTGEEVWSSKALDKGTITVADGLMFCVTEDKGIVALAHASSGAWNEISRFTLAPQSERRELKGKLWTPPVIARGRLFLRDQENLWCLQIAAPPEKRLPARKIAR